MSLAESQPRDSGDKSRIRSSLASYQKIVTIVTSTDQFGQHPIVYHDRVDPLFDKQRYLMSFRILGFRQFSDDSTEAIQAAMERNYGTVAKSTTILPKNRGDFTSAQVELAKPESVDQLDQITSEFLNPASAVYIFQTTLGEVAASQPGPETIEEIIKMIATVKGNGDQKEEPGLRMDSPVGYTHIETTPGTAKSVIPGFFDTVSKITPYYAAMVLARSPDAKIHQYSVHSIPAPTQFSAGFYWKPKQVISLESELEDKLLRGCDSYDILIRPLAAAIEIRPLPKRAKLP